VTELEPAVLVWSTKKDFPNNGSKYFFGPNSSVGQRVVVEKRFEKRGMQKRTAVVEYDTSNMIVVKYKIQGYRESFIKSDFLIGLVKFLV